MYKKRGRHGSTTQEGHSTPVLEKTSVAVGYALYHTQQFAHNLAASLQVSSTDLAAGLAALLREPPDGQVFRTDEQMSASRMRDNPSLGTQVQLSTMALADGSLRGQTHVKHRRVMSAAARKRISIAQKKSWAKGRGKRLLQKKKVARKPTGKLHWTQTPEGRAKQKAMMKARLATGWRPNVKKKAAAA